MSKLLPTYLWRRDGKAMPAIAVWLTLSILLHIALLLWNPPLRTPPSAEPGPPPLTVVLQPQPLPEAAPVPEPAPSPLVAAPPPPKPVVRPKPVIRPKPQPPARAPATPAAPPPPPVIALAKPKPEEPPAFTAPAPKPEAPPPPPAQVAPPAPPPQLTPQPPPSEPDLAAYVEARRRARGEVPADAPSPETERANRGALNSAMLKQQAPTTLTPQKPRNGYGSFEIRRRGIDYAEFMFKGWNDNFRRDGLELIEVRLGNHGNIDLAVVRSIIGVIRRTESGNFTWVSRRLGRSLTLSARTRDNAGLEEFMMQEFYDDLHRYR